jgi:heme/copper-type cytochrome/quinol oxidase subunit 2
VLAGVLTGVGGTYLYWKNPASPFSTREPVPFPLFALLCAGGWVWVPAIVILSEQLSPAASIVAMIGAFVLTSGLRRVSSSVQITIPHLAATPQQGGANLFVETLYSAPLEIYGYVVAIGLYAGATALFVRSNFIATVFLVLAACVFAWRKNLPQDQGFDRSRESNRAALRLVWITIPALLVTAWALLDGVAHRNIVEASTGENLHNAASLKKNSEKQSNGQTTPMGVDGYESVILWPYPDKRPVMPPITTNEVLLAPGSKEPLVIRFNGPYWYFQAPNKFPGPAAHKAQGTPIGFDIQSNNSVPLVMDAHQYLGAAIPLALCREITVEIENRDNTAGAISIGVLLMDGASAKQATLYLGEQPIVSTQPQHFTVKPSPVSETLHFPIPRAAMIHKFSEITVLVLPDIEHAFNAPKIAIQQFQLYPR